MGLSSGNSQTSGDLQPMSRGRGSVDGKLHQGWGILAKSRPRAYSSKLGDVELDQILRVMRQQRWGILSKLT